jgi:thiosulfate reductase/polysulfide reductase chain A
MRSSCPTVLAATRRLLTLANGRGASDATLITRYVLDPISGGAGMRVNFVRLVKEA